nr:MAG TPA: hypothetical protein [Caudoviricetes sp.]DAY42104.1 MAG TPA: hypothetical protein [Caudoviricetes sp.]
MTNLLISILYIILFLLHSIKHYKHHWLQLNVHHTY